MAQTIQEFLASYDGNKTGAQQSSFQPLIPSTKANNDIDMSNAGAAFERQAQKYRENQLLRREQYKAAVLADMESVKYDKAAYQALKDSGKGLAQMSDDEKSFISSRYQASDPSSRKSYTDSVADQYLSSVGLPASKELAAYRKAYSDYNASGSMEDRYKGITKEELDFITKKFGEDTVVGFDGNRYEKKNNKQVEYTDTLIDDQLRMIGLPSAEKMEVYHSAYLQDKEKKQKFADLTQKFYDDVFQERDKGTDLDTAWTIVRNKPEYAGLDDYFIEPAELPNEEDEAYSGSNGRTKFNTDTLKAIEQNHAYGNAEMRVSKEDYTKYESRLYNTFANEVEKQRKQQVYDAAQSALTKAATTDAERKEQRHALQELVSTFKPEDEHGNRIKASDWDGYLQLLNAGVPSDVINSSQVGGAAVLKKWNDKTNGNDIAKWAEYDLLFDGVTRNDSQYGTMKDAKMQTLVAKQMKNFDGMSAYDPLQYQKQVKRNNSTSRQNVVSAYGALYNAVNGKTYDPIVGATQYENQVLSTMTEHTDADKPLVDYLTDDERGTFNMMFSESPYQALRYLDKLEPLLDKRANRAAAVSLVAARSQQEAEDVAYSMNIRNVDSQIDSIKEGSTDYWHKEAWDKYRDYSDEALDRILAEDVNTSSEVIRTFYEGSSSMTDGEARDIMYVLETRQGARDNAKLAASLYGYTDEEGAKATESVKASIGQQNNMTKFVNGFEYEDKPTNHADISSIDMSVDLSNFNRNELEEEYYTPLTAQMTDEQKNQYNWLLVNKGEQEAAAYFNSIKRGLDTKAAATVMSQARSEAADDPFGTFVGSMAWMPYNGLMSMTGGLLNDVLGLDTTETQATQWDVGGVASEAVGMNLADSVASAFDNDGIGSVANYLYGVAKSSADSAVGAGLSKAVPLVGELALSGSAYASTLRHALNKGVSSDNAAKMAAASGVIEFVTEHMGIDHIFSAIEKAKGKAIEQGMPYFLNLLAEAGINFGSEAIEEGVGSVFETAADMLINGDSSELLEYYNNAITNGRSPEEATRLAATKFATDVGLEALAGGLAGSGSVVVAGTVPGVAMAVNNGLVRYAQGDDARAIMGHSNSFAAGRSVIDDLYGSVVGDAVQKYLDTSETVGDKKRINDIVGDLSGVSNTSMLYGVIFDSEGNMKLDDDQQVALASLLAIDGAQADSASIEYTYIKEQALQQGDAQRKANSADGKVTEAVKNIKTAQEVRTLNSNIEGNKAGILKAREAYNTKLNGVLSHLNRLAQQKVALAKKMGANVGNPKAQEVILNSLKAIQDEYDRVLTQKNEIESVDSITLENDVRQLQDQININQGIIDKHYASSYLFLNAATSNRGVYEGELKAAQAKIASLGNRIDSMMESEATDASDVIVLDTLQQQLADAQNETDYWSKKLRASSPTSLANAVAALDSGTAQDYIAQMNNSTEPVAVPVASSETASEAQNSGSSSNTENSTNEAQNTEESAAEDVKQETKNEEPKKTKRKTFNISKTMQTKINRIAKKLGVEVEWQTRDEIGGNGKYDPQTPNKVYLATDMIADSNLRTETVVAREFFTHEIVHYVANTKTYRRLASLAERYYKQLNADKGIDGADYYQFLIDRIIDKEKELHNRDFTVEQAREEITAMFTQEVLFSGESGSKNALNWLADANSGIVKNLLHYVEYLIKRGQVRRMKDGGAIKALLLDSERALTVALQERKVLDEKGLKSAFSDERRTDATQTADAEAPAAEEQTESVAETEAVEEEPESEEQTDAEDESIPTAEETNAVDEQVETDVDSADSTSQNDSKPTTVKKSSDKQKAKEALRIIKNVRGVDKGRSFSKGAFLGANGRQIVTDAFQLYRFNEHVDGIPMIGEDEVEQYQAKLDAITDNFRDKYERGEMVALSPMPTKESLVNAAKKLGYSTPLSKAESIPIYFGSGFPVVNARYMYEALTIFPDAQFFAEKGKQLSPIYVTSSEGDGVIVPIREQDYGEKDDVIRQRLFKRLANPKLTDSEYSDIRKNVDFDNVYYSDGDTVDDLVGYSERYTNPNVSGEAATLSGTNVETTDVAEAIDESAVAVNEDGEPTMNVVNNGNAAMMSLGTYENGGREALEEYLKKRSSGENPALTKSQAAEIMAKMDEIYAFSKEYANKYVGFGNWSYAQVKKAPNGLPALSVVTPNNEYNMNIDFSLVCVKRRALNAVINELVRRGKMETMDFSGETIARINEIIRSEGYETACLMCFVETTRYRQASFADSFVEKYNNLVNSLGGEADYHNFGGNETLQARAGIHELPDADLDWTEVDKVLDNYMARKGLKNLPAYNPNKSLRGGTTEEAIAFELKMNPSSRKLMLRGDLMSTNGFDSLVQRAPNILRLWNKKGVGGPKNTFSDMQYLNDIAKGDWNADKAYDVGGVRVQSFSDYVPTMFFDYVQMVADLAAGKMPAHAYTKELNFVKLFGMTGIKINMSLVPEVGDSDIVGMNYVRDAEGNIMRDESGEPLRTYAWAKESFGYDRKKGDLDYDLINRIQGDENYGKNCGSIAIGISDEHIMRMLRDPQIKMVIPYHRSNLAAILAEMMNIDRFVNYEDTQHTRKWNGKRWENLSPKEEYEFNKHLHEDGDPKKTVKGYLDWCAENHYAPKFEETDTSTKFKNEEGYYKLLEDFTLYDNNGNYTPQGAVQMRFAQDGEATIFTHRGQSIQGGVSELLQYSLEDPRQTMIEQGASDLVDKIIDTMEGRNVGDEMYSDGSTVEDLVETNEDFRRMFSNRGEGYETDADDVRYMELAEKYRDGSATDEETAELRNMVEGRAEALRAEVFAATDVPAYRIRRDAPPKKTIKVYKTFTLTEDGQPSALFVSSRNPLPVGVWLDAQDTFHFKDQRNGRWYVPSTKNPNTKGGATGRMTKLSDISESDLAELERLGHIKRGKNGKYTAKNLTSLAYRPGWHAGDLPFFPQGGMKVDDSNYENIHRYNQVVFECEMAADEDYTSYEIKDDGTVKYNDRQEMPVNGSYKFATNPMANTQDIGAWYISGSLKINRALTEEEANRILESEGRLPQEWQAYQDETEYNALKGGSAKAAYEKRIGSLDLDRLGYDPNRTAERMKLPDLVTYDDNGDIIPLSQRFNSEVNDVRYSDGETIDDLIAEYGLKQRSRRGEANNIRTPERTTKTTRVSDVAQTLKERQDASKAARDNIDNIIVETLNESAVPTLSVGSDAGLVYKPVTMEQMNQWADDYITKAGSLDQAMRDLSRDIPIAKLTELSRLEAAAMRVFAEIAQTDDFDVQAYREFVAAIGMMNSQWGRMGAAMRILNNSPLGRVEYMKKVVERINEENAKAMSKGVDKLLHPKGVKPIDIPAHLYKALEQARTPEEVRKAEFDISQSIGEQSPLSFADAMRNWRYFSMLFNPVTHARNILGNVSMLGMRTAKDAVAAGLERIATKTGLMKPEERTHNLKLKAPKNVHDFAVDLYLKNKDAVQGNDRYGVKDKMRDAVKKSPIKPFDWLMRANGNALEAEDAMFLRATYTAAAQQYIMARGIDVDNITPKQTAEINAYATKQAQEATYRDASALADTLNALSKQNAAWRFAIEAVMPFKKTPINVAKRGIEYSPAGLIKGVFDLARFAQQKGKNSSGDFTISASKVADELGKGLVGSALTLIGMWLAKAGILKLKAGDDDKAETFGKDTGHQDYSLEIGDLSIKIESVAPMTFPLFAGAAILDAFGEDGVSFDKGFAAIADSILSVADPLMDMSFMSSLNSALNSYSQNKIFGVVENAATSYINQYFPTLIGRLNTITTPTRRTTKSAQSAKEGIGTQRDYTLRSIATKVPGLNRILEPYVTVTGAYDTKTSFGDYALAVMNNLLSPVNVSVIDKDEATREISRLIGETGETSFVPRNPNKYFTQGGVTYNLTADEYTEYAKDHNETVFAALTSTINSDEYQRATDDERADMLENTYDAAHKTAQKKWKAIIVQQRDSKNK